MLQVNVNKIKKPGKQENQGEETTVRESERERFAREQAERVERGEIFACPHCGRMIPAGTTKCSYCHGFVDPVTKQKRTNISDEELRTSFEEGQRNQQQAKKVRNIGIGLIVLSFVLFDPLGTIAFIVGVIMFVLAMMGLRGASETYKGQMAQTVIPDVLSQTFENLEYEQRGHIPNDVVLNTDMHFPFEFNDVEGNDHVKGTYKGVGIEMSDLNLVFWKDTVVEDDDGHLVKDRYRAKEYLIQWVIIDLHKELSAEVCVYEKVGKWKKDSSLIETENEAFNQKYAVSCDNEHDAFYILTPHMMDHIMTMDERAGGDTYLHFQKDGKVHLAVQSGRNLLEVGDNMDNINLDDLRQQFKDEIKYVTDMVDELLSANY